MKNWCCCCAFVHFENDGIVCIEWLWSRIKISIWTFLLCVRRFLPPFVALNFGLIISTIVSCYADGTNCICGFFPVQWLYRNCEHEKTNEIQIAKKNSDQSESYFTYSNRMWWQHVKRNEAIAREKTNRRTLTKAKLWDCLDNKFSSCFGIYNGSVDAVGVLECCLVALAIVSTSKVMACTLHTAYSA